MARSHIGNLPRKNAKYWTDIGAEYEIHKPRLRRCEHEFAQIAGNELECKKCHIGYYITPDFKLKDGHIYKGEKVVI